MSRVREAKLILLQAQIFLLEFHEEDAIPDLALNCIQAFEEAEQLQALHLVVLRRTQIMVLKNRIQKKLTY